MLNILDRDIEKLKLKTLCSKCEHTGFIKHRTNTFLVKIEECECIHKYNEMYKILESHIPQRYREISIDIIEKEFTEVNKDSTYKLLKYNENIGKCINKGIGLFISGSRGAGKRFLGVVTLKSALKSGYSAYFLCVDSLITYLMDTKDRSFQRRFKEFCYDKDLILIDDIDKLFDETYPYYVMTVINDLIKSRYYEAKSLIAISHMYKKDFVDAYPDIAALFEEKMIEVSFKGNHRKRILNALERSILYE